MAQVVQILFTSFLFLFFHYNHTVDAEAQSNGTSTDHAALLSFRSSITADPNNYLSNWGSTNHCNWTGIKCHPLKNHVIELVLTGQSLEGTINPAISALSFLTILDLSYNFFSGSIPAELGMLSRLQQLSLSNNLFTGPVPSELGYLSKLFYLDMGANMLSGFIPETLFCNSTSLQYIDLSNNTLTGEIPYRTPCQLPNLRFLLLWSNYLRGPIPQSLSNSSLLQWIDLESNFFTGLPSNVFNKLPLLQSLYLSYNNLSSPDSHANLGPFFASLRNNTKLQEIELAGNNLHGWVPPLIGMVSPSLRQLHLEDNQLSGPIPPTISFLVNLTYLNLSNNHLNGSIPPDICRLQKLERLYLMNNELTGQIPPAIGEITHLGLVDFSRNRLSGTIPNTFANLTQLRRLMLHHNQLSGVIPSSLGNCVNLEILDLSYNKLAGSIPTDLAALSSLKLYLNLSNNFLEGQIPLELTKMEDVLAIDLSSNNLAGAIPPQLGSCVALENLNLSYNYFSGPLPGSVAALPYLQVLDVSRNRLVGTLPPSLQASATLQQLNISFNNFSGAVSSEGIFANLGVDSFLGNSALCGSIPGLPKCGAKSVLHRHIFLPIIATLVGTTFVLLFIVLFMRSSRKPMLESFKEKSFIEIEEEKENDYPRITYRQLMEATRGFSDSRLIGAGRFGQVYEGTLHDKTKIAVKVLDPRNGGIEISGSFKRECQVLKRTRHRNLIRVITTCSRPDFKALVLPLMPNGSLETYLYPFDSPRQGLYLHELLSILIDVAEGMAYLHHFSPVKVVHCDLKPSNVLLDNDMRAVVSDFGISRLVREREDDNRCFAESAPCNSMTGLLQGSVGYIAPGTSN
jgi:Leucine-rich repeat (LRR) protein